MGKTTLTNSCTVVGGNAFNATMEGDIGASPHATCTTCQMSEDFSNYWTAHLFFKSPTNGSYHRVPVLPVQPLLGGSDGAQGGLTVYYTQFDLSRDNLNQQKITAFKPVSCDPDTDFNFPVGSKNLQRTGFPHDCRQSNYDWKAPSRSPLPVSFQERRSRSRARRFPLQAM